MAAVSVTIPVFNEEAIIEKVIDDCYSEIIEKIPGSELIIVNDGSTDSTSNILERLKQESGQLKVIHLEKNSGHAKALRVAFEQACKPLVFHIDGDNQFSIKDFWKLYRCMEEYDIAVGYRARRYDPFYRKVLSLLLRWLSVILFGVSFRDVNVPFNLIKAETLRDIMRDTPGDLSATHIILLILAKLKKYRIAEIPVEHFERKTGRSTMTGLYLFNLCLVYFSDLLKLKYLIMRGKLKI